MNIRSFNTLFVATVLTAFPARPVLAAADVTLTDPTEILSRMHKTNQDEIAMGQLAKEKATAPEIKRFGERLIKDHTDADHRVVALAKEQKITLRDPVPQTDVERQKMAAHAESTAKLKAAAGADFDRQFVAVMEHAHGNSVDVLSQSRARDSKVQKLVTQLVPIIRQHLTIASELDAKSNPH